MQTALNANASRSGSRARFNGSRALGKTALQTLLRSVVGIASLLLIGAASFAQTSATGAITGTVSDPSKAVVPDAKITAINEATGETRTLSSSSIGSFLIPLLTPGSYTLSVSKAGFKQATYNAIQVDVTETRRLDVELQIGAATETVSVVEQGEELKTESSALGNVTTSREVRNLPLVTRNYTQIIALSPGVASDVTNAGDLGRGRGGEAGGTAPVAHGTTQRDNNFQMNGLEINDVQGSGFFGGGVAIPNPDAIQEFKVQTSQYDAAYGRNAGANVDVVTKSGTNNFHGSVFEYFRNEVLNANELFRKLTNQPRPVLRQNQYGFAFGGPAVRDKLFFFGSYQGTKQQNGVASGCSTSFKTPALTNDRSRTALGALFAGQKASTGAAVAADGSNISAPALALLQMKLPNGQYLIPTPQVVDNTQPFATRGFSTFSNPCKFDEDQYIINGDYQQTSKSRFSARYFWDNSDQNQTLPITNLGGPTAPGFPVVTHQEFRVASLTHNYIFSSTLVNQVAIAYHRQDSNSEQKEAFHYAQIGVNAPSFDTQPSININGGLTLGGNGQTVHLIQNHYDFQDTLFWTKGRHSFSFGGGVIRSDNDVARFQFLAGLVFLGFPDFLLGQAGNVFQSLDLAGQFQRQWRAWDGNVFAQDNFKLTARLTLNLGFRYERLGDFSDQLGRNSGFNPALANPNPPASGTLAGYTVPSNYTGPLPAGVTRTVNDLGIEGVGQNTWNPRVGFAWRLPHTNRLVLRGGYGIYHTRTTDQPLFQLLTSPPFSVNRSIAGTANATATFANPFPPAPAIPVFPPYSPRTVLSQFAFAPNFQPPITQHYSLGLQTELARDLVLEVGYAGARGQHLIRTVGLNQAQLASLSNPIRGVTTNTKANILQRVPIQGFQATGLTQVQSEGSTVYNSLEASLRKRLSHGLQLLASYTFARDLAINTSTAIGGNGGTSLGNQLIEHYGPDSFVRPHRFVLSYLYDLPGPQNKFSLMGRVLGGWEVAGVTVFQSGQRLSITQTNSNNVYGIVTSGGDFAQLAPGGCRDAGTSGPVDKRLTSYIDTSCFVAPMIIGSDGIATDFGNAPVGILHGPDQRNWDIALLKRTPLRWPNEVSNVEFRTEFFNAFNTPQFSNPTLNRSLSTFGQITTTSVAPRIVQFALKVNF